ncbi:hypothetical protein MTO96_024843 [Rhipicephalus appendiculatus]
MGLYSPKPDEENPATGLKRSDTRLLRQTWHYYCMENHDYAVIIFVALFIKSPESLQLFPRFRDKPLGKLPDDAQFRAHAISVSFQLTSIVDYADDAVLLEALLRKNAVAHAERRGVMPEHFRLLGKAVVEVLQTRDEKRMSPAAVHAWEKLFDFMVKITEKVYEEQEVPMKPMDFDAPKVPGVDAPKAPGCRSGSALGTPADGKSPAAVTPKGSLSPRTAHPPTSTTKSSPQSSTPDKIP